ncbi:5-aminolevulinate synthase [Salipiger sp.]|uniref:5-aminolevulinate synthase n=1 Tax=Salipiger sp. TaxID=2078585 RepID=UPI003A977BA3
MPFALAALPAAPLLILATAFGYALATIGMKTAADGHHIPGIVLGIIGFFIAGLSEIVLMRRLDLSLIYILIVAAETMLVLGYAMVIGEGFGLRQMAGAALMLAGLAAVTS